MVSVACAALDCTLELAAEVEGAKELLEPAAAGAEPEAGLLAEADCEALFCGDAREAAVPPEARAVPLHCCVVASAIGVSKIFWRISSLIAATGLSGLLVRMEMVRSR